ncbi:MAG: tetratricopeptide repeat protein [Brumimicrobium sp.]|nr:tetratricopeptide repeat protein [Brumimicrobium sp.]
MKFFVSLVVLLLVATFSYGQITYDGVLTQKETQKPLAGVTVKVLSESNAVISSSTTDAKGKYSVQFPAGKKYTIEYSKGGFVSKIISVDVNDVYEEDIPPGGKIFPPINLDLFEEIPGADLNFLKTEPVAKWYFDRDHMEVDIKAVNAMKKKIEDRIAQAASVNQANDAKYATLIKEADDFYTKKDYQNALNKYVEAVKISGKQQEKHPNERIVEIEDILQKIKEKELEDKQANQAYYNLIEAADNLAKNKEYDKAIAKYKEAIGMKGDEQYPKEQVDKLEAEKEVAAKRIEYDAYIQKGDGFMKQNSLQAARDQYLAAQKLFPNEEYPRKQLDIIKGKLEAQEAQKAEKEKYNKAIELADQLFNSEKYEDAIKSYKEALTYESAATYPNERISMAEAKIVERDEANKKKKQFDDLVAAADKDVNISKFEDAIAKYTEALTLFEDQAVKTKKDNAEKALDAQKSEAAKLAQIATLLTSAKQNMEAKEFEKALGNYDEILGLNPQHPEAIEGKAKATKYLNDKAEFAKQEKAFNELVAQADQAFENGNYEDAKNKYFAAKKIFDDNAHVNQRIDEVTKAIRDLEDKARLNKDIQTLLDQATQLKSQNKWNEVIQKYTEALKLDSKRTDISDLLEQAKRDKAAWDDQQSTEQKFASLKGEGVVLMARKEFANAKSKFEEALKIHEDAEITAHLKTIEENLAKEAQAKENEKLYKEKMTLGQTLATQKNYEDALNAYKEALSYKENDVEATAKVKEMQNKMAELSTNQQKQERYEAAMKKGKESMDAKDFASAVKSFDDALLEKPLDKDATAYKNDALAKISQLKSEEAKYNALIESAASLLSKGKQQGNNETLLNEAKNKYLEAQKMRQDASEPQNRIIEIDELLRQAKDNTAQQEDLNRRYQEQIDKATIAAQNTQYEQAIEYLKAALNIKPSEQYPKDKIEEYQTLLTQLANDKDRDQKYQDLIRQADSYFDNQNYNASIETYQSAIKLKDESYPKAQIQRAKDALLTLSERNRDYQNFIDKGDKAFSNKEYEEALNQYEAALKEKQGDKYAQDKIDETKQIISQLAEKEKLDAKTKAEFDAYIKEADKLFNDENYIKAKENYDKALGLYPNDVYAIEREKICVLKAKESTDSEVERRYRQIIDKADEYFIAENYDKATNLYKRALNLRAYDRYPQEKLDEIQAILNDKMRENYELEDLGVPVNISIMEGEALLQEGDRQRDALKQETVEQHLIKNEEVAADRSQGDYVERVNYDNEIIAVKDRASQVHVDEMDKHRGFIEDVNDRVNKIEAIVQQQETYEQGDIQRAYNETVFIEDDLDNQKAQKDDDHKELIERVKEIEKARDEKDIAEYAHHHVRVTSNEEELVKVDRMNEQMNEIYQEEQRSKEVRIDQIEQDREARSFSENDDNYAKIVKLQDDATLADIKDAESKREKLAIQDQLRDDIAALSIKIEEKNTDETNAVYNEQLDIDALLTAATDQYQAIQATKDDARQLAVEKLKDLDQEQSQQAEYRSNTEYQSLQSNRDNVELVTDMQSEQARKQEKDLAQVDNTLKDYMDELDRQSNLREQQEVNERNSTTNELNRIDTEETRAKEEKVQQIKQNYEDVKGLTASLNQMTQANGELERAALINSQDRIDKEEGNSRTIPTPVKNTLGDKYPEGVSQENFVQNDKNGIAEKIITRRIVVKDGRGDVYIRTQSRNGVTYSKNGVATTEETWISGTENANLTKHY